MSNYTLLDRDEICRKLKELAKGKKKLLIVCHKHPDGDTVGSAFALKLIYEQLGGSAKCVCESDAPKYLHFLYSGQITLGYRVKDEERHGAICAVDVATKAQLGKLDFLADRFDFMIDHHGTGEPFAPNWVEPDASACAELICKVYRKLVLEGSIPKDADIARRIYAGISADSGSFKYSNTTPETHMLAASLIDDISKANDGKISAADIARALFDNKSREDLAATKLTIENIRYMEDGRVAYALITWEGMQKSGVTEGALGGSIDILRGINGVDAAFILKQQKDRKSFRVSARSNCELNVSEICAKFGGGGHAKASGASVTADSPEEAEALLKEAFRNALKKYTEEDKA